VLDIDLACPIYPPGHAVTAALEDELVAGGILTESMKIAISAFARAAEI